MSRSIRKALTVMVLLACYNSAAQSTIAADQAQIDAYNQQATALAETRPILSVLKSVKDAYAAVAEIRERAKEIVSECTDKPGADMGQVRVISGETEFTGKYYAADQMKLRDFDHCIQKQQSILGEILSANQQDKRPLRASEADRQTVEKLRAEARSSFEEMITDANKLTVMIMGSRASQVEVTASAKALVKATGEVEHKLRAIEHALHTAQKNQETK